MSSVTAIPPALPSHQLRVDFPTWLPAMLVKELRQGLRTKGFVGTLVGFQTVMTLVTVFAIAGGVDSGTFQMLQVAYWAVVGVQLILITPARAMVGLQSELESRSIDLLLLTRLTAWRIVIGKWVSLLAQAALLIVATLPYGVARYFFGSVDLVGEMKILAALFAASSVLTAAALWSSALSKVVRVALGLALFFAIQFTVFGMRTPFFTSRGVGGPAGIFNGSTWLLIFNFGVVLALCLMGAVSHLSPAAESKSPPLRALPFIVLLSVPFAGLQARGQFTTAVLLFVFIAVLEFARNVEPLACHWRPWRERGKWAEWVGRFAQPGWASTLEWVLLFAGTLAVAGFVTANPIKFARLALLGAEGLVFPALMLTWMSSKFTQRAAGYFLLLAGASTLAAVAAATASFTRVNAVAEALLFLLPISSFWTTLDEVRSVPALLQIAQALIAVALLGVALWRAKPYRLHREAFSAAPRQPRP